MTRDEIYDHLAQVYLGKRKKKDVKKQRQFNAWLFINILITGTIFFSVFYGLTAFFTQKPLPIENSVMYSVNRGLLSIAYNFEDSFSPEKRLSLDLNDIDVSKYDHLLFSVRGKEEGTPGIIKVVFENAKNEAASYYVQGVDLDWREQRIPLSKFKQITDWSNITRVSFVLEVWNVRDPKGIVLIEDVNFSS
jgi:hypothetical protein